MHLLIAFFYRSTSVMLRNAPQMSMMLLNASQIKIDYGDDCFTRAAKKLQKSR